MIHAHGAGPYLRTGDLGFMRDGEVFVTGRIKDLIIAAGKNHHPLDIEQAVWDSSPNFRPGCGAAFTIDGDDRERVVVVQELADAAAPELAELAAQLRYAVHAATGVTVQEIMFIRKRSIPKTSSGKIQRRGCRELYLEGRLAKLYHSVAPSD